MDDPRLENYNVDKKAEDFYNYFQQMSKFYRQPIVAHTFGNDFQWSNAYMFYKNLDKLMNYINSRPEQFKGFNIIYSTPSDYIEAINK